MAAEEFDADRVEGAEPGHALDRLAQLVKAAGVDDQGAKHDVVWV